MLSKKQIINIVSIVFIMGLCSGPAVAFEDILFSPAIKSNQCRSSALLDVSRSGDRLVAVGERGHILFTDDTGSSWQQATVPATANLNAVDFVSPQHGWAVGHEAVVLHSRDGGQTWEKQLDGFEAAKISLSAGKKRLSDLEAKQASGELDLSAEIDLAAWRLEEAQRDISVGPAKPLMDVWFKNEQEGFVVGAYGYLYRTMDGGKTWMDAATLIDNPDGMHLYAIDSVKGGDIYIAAEEGNVFRSRDGGDTWELLDLNYGGGLFGVVGSHTEGRVYIFGLRGNVFQSDDSGQSWRRLETGTLSTFFSGIALPNGGALFVGQDGVIISCDGTVCRRIPRKDRTTLTAAAALGGGRLLLLSMCGDDEISVPETAEGLAKR
jgi:photosystem II stability/assembly factor-like uncharacterized protein